jgi:putative ABC transport system ATP-binding protein
VMTAITAKKIIKDFESGDQKNRVLNGIDIEVKLGQMTMLVGPSGCGKTTLISILTGILSSTSGIIDVMGKSITQMSDKERVLFRRNTIGFIFQQFNLLPALTAAENAAMPLIADDIPIEVAVKKSKLILSKLGMKNHVDKLPRQLSGGQQQRIAIARALIHDPPIIVCDEPTSSLDAKTGKEVMELLRDVASTPNRAVLIVTHDSRIYHYADRIIEMNDGQIFAEHNPKNYQHQE